MYSTFFSTLVRWVGSFIKHGIFEREIREWLQEQGYNINTTVISEVHLQAIERPGWVQVYSFRLSKSSANQTDWQQFGVLRSDERFGKSQIKVYDDQAARNRQLTVWTENLIARKSI